MCGIYKAWPSLLVGRSKALRVQRGPVDGLALGRGSSYMESVAHRRLAYSLQACRSNIQGVRHTIEWPGVASFVSLVNTNLDPSRRGKRDSIRSMRPNAAWKAARLINKNHQNMELTTATEEVQRNALRKTVVRNGEKVL